MIRNKLIETLRGVGEVTRSNQHIASGTYSLSVMQEITTVESFGGVEEIPGLKKISGLFTINPEEINQTVALNTLMSDMLTLRLSDGRRLPINLNPKDQPDGVYSISLAPPGDFLSD